MTMRSLTTDYLVVGAGAMGMAFTDALIDHADVHVTLVDRRHAAGGHWQDAYPFVQLHQASVFYGVASTVLGTRRRAAAAARRQGSRSGPGGRRSRATTTTSCIAASSGRAASPSSAGASTTPTAPPISSRPGCRARPVQVDVRRRVVDATYLSPTIPATTPPPFGVADDVRVVAVNELAGLADAPSSFVIVGSGKTATDGIVWLLANGVAPDRIVWVRPRDPWMLNRAVVQPDPVVALGLAADTMAAAADAESLDDLFLRLEAAGVMLRIDTRRRAHHGEDPDARRLGARPAPHHRERRPARPHQARDVAARSCSTRASFPSRRARSSCTAPRPGCSTRRWCPSGAPTRSGSRRSAPASRASTRRWPATWRPPATTTASATGCARPTPSPTTRRTGRRCRSVAPLATRALRRRARHRRVGQRLRPQPGAHRAVPARRSRGAGRRRPPGRRRRARARPHGRARRRAAVERRRGVRPRLLPAENVLPSNVSPVAPSSSSAPVRVVALTPRWIRAIPRRSAAGAGSVRSGFGVIGFGVYRVRSGLEPATPACLRRSGRVTHQA